MSQENSHTPLSNGFVRHDTILATADSYTSSDPTQPVLIRTNLDEKNDSIPKTDQYITVPQRFIQIAQKYPTNIAFHYQPYDETEKNTPSDQQIKRSWSTVTYKEYLQNVRNTAKAFIALGLQPKHSVGIIGFNSPEWFYSNFGAIFAGGLSTGIYTTNNPETCLHVLSDSSADIVVVEDDSQMAKIQKIKDKLPNLRAIVQYKGTPNPVLNSTSQPNLTTDLSSPKIFSWKDFIELHVTISDAELDERLNYLYANMCCSLIYTSGTTGNPKGVMISHDNIMWTSKQVAKMVGLRVGQEVLMTYLPLSHIAAQIVDMYMVMETANTLYFAHPDVLKGTLVQYLKHVRPTIFIGVPRVWEKMAEKMQEVGRSTRGIKKKIADWAKSIGTQGTRDLMKGHPIPWSWGLANALVFRKIHKALGLDRCTYMVSTGAPISSETLAYFNALNIRIMQVYGMSECTGPATLNIPITGKFWNGSVGLAMDGSQVKIDDSPDDNSHKELCLRGRHVFMGYIHRDKETRDMIDKDGWLKTGDIGAFQITETGPFVYITGRIKELIITAGGENIAPVPIEDALKEELRDLISNAMVVGDYKKFLSVLLTLKCETDPVTNMPSDDLTQGVRDYLVQVLENSDHGITHVSEICEPQHPLPPRFNEAIRLAINRVNERAVSRAAMIQKWKFVPRDFSVPGGELGPTLKLRRPIVLKMYANIINSLYDENKNALLQPVIDYTQSNGGMENNFVSNGLESNSTHHVVSKKFLSTEDVNLKHSESYITHI